MAAENAVAFLNRYNGMSRAAAAVTKVTPEPGAPGAIVRPIVAWYGFVSVLRRSSAAPTRSRTFDVQDAGVGELDLDPVVLVQGRGDDLLLDPPVERHDGQPVVVGAGGDQRVGVGQLGESGPQVRALLGPDRGHRRLQGRRGEVRLLDQAVTEPVADAGLGQSGQPADLPGGQAVGPHPAAVVEQPQPADLAGAPLRQVEAGPYPQGSRRTSERR